MNKKIEDQIVVGAIIVDNNKALIVQRSSQEDILPRLWELPSGKTKTDEGLKEALIREVKEETNLDIEILQEIESFNYQIENKMTIKRVKQINFLAKAQDIGALKLSKEHQDYRWIIKNQIDDFDISDKTKEVLRQALDQNP